MKCVKKSNLAIGINNQMIATIDSPHSLINGPPGIIEFNKEGIAYTVIQNCAPYSMWIERNNSLGFAEQHTEEAKSKKLDKNFIASLMQQGTMSCIDQNKSMQWTT